jgi:hypothetical protein
MRHCVREHLEVDDRDFPLWLSHKTALEGIPETDTEKSPTTTKPTNYNHKGII